MPRIFKGSESTLRLLISKTGDYQALTEIKIKLYTTNIENAIEIIDGIQVCKNIATITLAPRAFMGMEDGLINYIIDGATEDDVFHTERQSNYMLKSLSYINEDGVASQTMTIESNGEYRVTPNDGLYVDINVNVPDLNGSYDDGFNAGYDQGKTDGVNEQKSKLESINITENGTYTKEDGYNQIEVNVPDLNGSYDEGYAQGKTDGINEQKGKLESISITENGVYSKEDGYNHIEVNVPDCNLINPIVFSEKGGNTINAENVQIPTFVYEGNQYYNVGSFNLADIEEFKIHILFKPNNSGDAEPINIFGCEDTDWDNTTFGARIYQGQITFRMSGQEVVSPYTENTWYDVEMGYNTTKRWVILNGETLYENTHAFFNKPRQTLMIGAINSGGNAFRPFYGKIAAIYIKSNGNQVWLLPKKDGTMSVYWNDRNNTRNSISGENNARFENDYISGDGMKSITWLGNLEDKWVTPSMSDRDGNGYIVVYPSEGYNSLKRTVINPQTLYNEGVNEQKSKLESINITENGTYDREDGYNHIEVNVADLNGSYEEGYEQGQADVAENARVLNVTENGNYLSKFSDPVVPTLVTGRYADGTDFYSYAELNGKVFNTKITPTENSRLEFWYKGDNENAGKSFNVIIGAEKSDGNGYEIMYNMDSNSNLRFELGLNAIEYTWDDTVWHHILIAKEKEDDSWMTLWIDEVKIREFGNIPFNPQSPFYINCVESNTDLSKNANGYFGMIKIDDVVIIPTADGFQNVNTGELLEVVKDGAYIFTENLPIYAEGELYKTINVNVIPKVNVKEAGLSLGYSTFTEVPEWVDFNGVTDMTRMFSDCSNLQTIPLIDTSNVINMSYMFSDCSNLQTIPLIDTSNVINMSYMFSDCSNLQTIPSIKTSNVVNMDRMFYSCTNLKTLPKLDVSKVTNIMNYFRLSGGNLTDVGGWENLKINWNDNYGLVRCPNLTYQSCINILNGLYDFVGNGSTETRTLKVHQNFLTTVGDEISIGVAKGWQITV